MLKAGSYVDHSKRAFLKIALSVSRDGDLERRLAKLCEGGGGGEGLRRARAGTDRLK